MELIQSSNSLLYSMRLKIIILVVFPALVTLTVTLLRTLLFYEHLAPDFAAANRSLVFGFRNQTLALKLKLAITLLSRSWTNLPLLTAFSQPLAFSPSAPPPSLASHTLATLRRHQQLLKVVPLEVLCMDGFYMALNHSSQNSDLPSVASSACADQTPCLSYIQNVTTHDSISLVVIDRKLYYSWLFRSNGTTCAAFEPRNEVKQLARFYFETNQSIYNVTEAVFQLAHSSLLPRLYTLYDSRINATFMLPIPRIKPHHDTHDHVVGILVFLTLLTLFYSWRKAVVLSNGFFVPLLYIRDNLLTLEIEELEQRSLCHQAFNASRELYEFVECLFLYINSIKYQSNRFGLDANSLIQLSQSKQFFKSIKNLKAVGICCNNIAQIHANNKRYLEALNEQEESIQLAEQEMQSLLQVEKFQSQLSSSNSNWNEVYMAFKNKFLQRFFREDAILERFQSVQQTPPNVNMFQSIQVKPRSHTVGIHNEAASPSIQEYSFVEDEQLRQCKIKLVNRRFQLIQILISFSNEHNDLFLNEVISQIKSLYQEISEIKPQNEKLMELSSSLNSKLAYYYALTGQVMKSRQLLVRINLRTLKSKYKIPYIKAIIDLMEKRPIQACQKLLDLLILDRVVYNYYDFSLRLLKEIFKAYNLNAGVLRPLENSPVRLQLIALIDYTRDITEEQLNLAHSYLRFVLDRLESTDRVALYAYNETLHEISRFQHVDPHLKYRLDTPLIVPGGKTKLFEMLKLVASTMFTFNPEAEIPKNTVSEELRQPCLGDSLDQTLQTDLHDCLKREVRLEDERRILLVFPEQVKDYSAANMLILQTILVKRGIVLVVVGIANQKRNQAYLSCLEQAGDQVELLSDAKQVCQYFSSLKQRNPVKECYFEFF